MGMNVEEMIREIMEEKKGGHQDDDDRDPGPNRPMDVQVSNLLARLKQMENTEVPPIGSFVKANAFYRMPNDRRPGLVVEHIPPDEVGYKPINDKSGSPVERTDVIVAILEDDCGVMLIPVDSRFLETHHEATKAAEEGKTDQGSC